MLHQAALACTRGQHGSIGGSHIAFLARRVDDFGDRPFDGMLLLVGQEGRHLTPALLVLDASRSTMRLQDIFVVFLHYFPLCGQCQCPLLLLSGGTTLT